MAEGNREDTEAGSDNVVCGIRFARFSIKIAGGFMDQKLQKILHESAQLIARSHDLRAMSRELITTMNDLTNRTKQITGKTSPGSTSRT